MLTADPPVASNVDDGAVQTELDRGIEYVKHTKFAQAKSHFKRAIEIKPSATAWTYLGVASEQIGDRSAAEDAYRTALRLDPSFVEAAQNLGALYLDPPPRPDDAIAVLRSAIEKAPDAKLYHNLAFAYGLKGDISSASKAYEASLTTSEDAEVRFAYGSLLFENKETERAAEQLKKGLNAALQGKNVALLVSIGRLLGSSKTFSDCVRAFDRAIQIDSNDPEWFVRRGICRHEIKDEEGARTDYEAALRINSKFAAAHYYLALSYLSTHARIKATFELEKAKQLGGDGLIGKAAREKLDEVTKRK